jgi:hypothetical protein
VVMKTYCLKCGGEILPHHDGCPDCGHCATMRTNVDLFLDSLPSAGDGKHWEHLDGEIVAVSDT